MKHVKEDPLDHEAHILIQKTKDLLTSTLNAPRNSDDNLMYMEVNESAHDSNKETNSAINDSAIYPNDEMKNLWKKYNIDHQCQSYEIMLRNDINCQEIKDIFQTIGITYGYNILEVQGNNVVARNSLLNLFIMAIGITAMNTRILVLKFSWKKRGYPEQLDADAFYEAMLNALHDANLSLSSLSKNTLSNVVDVTSLSLDPDFLSDMETMIHNQTLEIFKNICTPLEEFVRNKEIACAQLLSRMRITYDKYHIPMPAPPKSFNNNANETQESSLKSDTSKDKASSTTDSLPSTKTEKEKIKNMDEPLRFRELQKQLEILAQKAYTQILQHERQLVERTMEKKSSQVKSRLRKVNFLRNEIIDALCRKAHDLENADYNRTFMVLFNSKDLLLCDSSCLLNKLPGKYYLTYSVETYKSGTFHFIRFYIEKLHEASHSVEFAFFNEQEMEVICQVLAMRDQEFGSHIVK